MALKFFGANLKFLNNFPFFWANLGKINENIGKNTKKVVKIQILTKKFKFAPKNLKKFKFAPKKIWPPGKVCSHFYPPGIVENAYKMDKNGLQYIKNA